MVLISQTYDQKFEEPELEQVRPFYNAGLDFVRDDKA
jgi:hypothetical protein